MRAAASQRTSALLLYCNLVFSLSFKQYFCTD